MTLLYEALKVLKYKLIVYHAYLKRIKL